MNIESDVVIGAGIVAILTGFFAFAWKLISLSSDFGKMNLKIDTLWGLFMNRALQTGLDSNVLQMNSPVTATPKMEAILEPMAIELGEFYRREGYKMTGQELFIAIEQRFGDRILHNICIPYALHQGAVIIAAADVAKKQVA